MSGYGRMIAVVLTAVITISLCSFCASAKIDNASWDDSEEYLILKSGEESNSAVNFAYLNVKYDPESNRINLLFTLTLNEVNEENLSGIRMNINSLGEVLLMSNGEQQYDTDVYYAELSSSCDKIGKSLVFDVTLGIKPGIPNDVNLQVVFIDMAGINSNLFEVNITPGASETEEASSANSTKQKTTKKKRTTKVKTTKAKQTKTTKSKTQKETDAISALAVVNAEELGSSTVEKSDSKAKIIWISAAAVVVAGLAAGCIIAIRNKHIK